MPSSHASLRLGLPALAGLFVLVALAGGCKDVPEVRYETTHFEIATDFDAPVCQGTLNYFEDHLAFAETELGQKLPYGEKIRLYWLERSLDEWCSDTATGCFYPGTRVIFAEGKSITHEVIHALLNAEARTSLFIEEGLAELYSGVGARYYKDPEHPPPVGELIWLTPKEYDDRQLDYSLAGHFVAWVEAEFGRAATQRLAQVVIEGGGPKELEAALDRVTSAKLEWIEQWYGEYTKRSIPGVRELEVEPFEFGKGVEFSLRCDDENTLGPLPNGAGGMYQVRRFYTSDPLKVDFGLYGGDDVRLDIINVTLERVRGQTIDFYMPLPTPELEHPRLEGDEEREVELPRGTHLLVVSSPGYEAEEVIVEATVKWVGRPHPI